MSWEIKTFVDLAEFEKIQKVVDYFIAQKALPKWIANAGQFVMVLQAGKDLWLSMTSSMAGIALINWIITVHGTVGALVMKKTGIDWRVLESTSKHCEIEIWRWKDEETTRKEKIKYTIEEAQNAWLLSKDNRKNYPKDMLYRKCLARARKIFCPEVLDWVAIYEDYQDIEKDTPVVNETVIMENFKKVGWDVVEWETIEAEKEETLPTDEDLPTDEGANE